MNYRLAFIVTCFVYQISILAIDTDKIEIRTIGFPPYGFKTQNISQGVYFDAANLMAKELELEANNIITPYARIKSELEHGRADMSIMFKYEELDPYVIYVTPLPTLKTVILGLKGSSFTSIDSLSGKKIAYLRGGGFSLEIDNNPDIIILRTTDFSQGLKMLLGGRADAIIGPMEPILSAAAKLNISLDKFGEPLVVSERTPWVQISKRSHLVQSSSKIKLIFERMIEEGVLNKLKVKYLTPLKSGG